MSSHPGHEAKPESREKPGDHKTEAATPSAPSKADRIRLLLKMVVRFGVMGLAPTIAIAALVVAVIALNSNKSNVTQLSKIEEEVTSLNSSLSSTKAELDKLKFTAAKEKNAQSESHSKNEERISKIIQNITPMQVKMKIRPTLEEQLSQPISAAVAATSAPVVPVATHTVSAPPVAEVHAIKPEPAKSLPTKPTPKNPVPPVNEPVKKSSSAPTSTHSENSVRPQVKVMKEAIEQFNGKR